MTDYDLYYWPIPCRGQFVRAVLALAGKTWTEHDGGEIVALMEAPFGKKPVPFMGPPVLIDRAADVAIAQTPAIILYLGETLNLLPATPLLRAETLKVMCDANDVIDEITLSGGRQMWTAPRWRAFLPRLERWMMLWEETGRRHGLTQGAGNLLGGDGPGMADVITAVLWGTLADRFPRIELIFEDAAPLTAALTRRVGRLPPLAALAKRSKADWGEVWCGGQIEASLRKMLG